jgi:hypothetical protein
MAEKKPPPETAAECRREAIACMEIAERMSLRVDRERMLDMAMQWLELAEKLAHKP